MTNSLTGQRRTPDPTAAAWGNELRRYRDAADLTQTDLAEILGIHQTTVSQIELGARVPSTSMQRRIAQQCDLDDATVVRLVRGGAA